MTKRKDKEWNVEKRMDAETAQRAMRLDEDLEIMDRHAADLAGIEEEEQDSMRRWDREHKNARLHSVPRHLKHVR
jgi:aminopeptidase C